MKFIHIAAAAVALSCMAPAQAGRDHGRDLNSDIRLGACCTIVGCLEVPERVCEALGGDFFRGRMCDEVDCRPFTLGACCLPQGCLDDVPGIVCSFLGGRFVEGRSCDEVECDEPVRGACCFGRDMCIDRTTRDRGYFHQPQIEFLD